MRHADAHAGAGAAVMLFVPPPRADLRLLAPQRA